MEYDQLYPKVRWRGRLYRIHKPLGNDMVRLITMDRQGIVDVPKSEVVFVSRATNNGRKQMCSYNQCTNPEMIPEALRARRTRAAPRRGRSRRLERLRRRVGRKSSKTSSDLNNTAPPHIGAAFSFRDQT
jgi:hypothetical protein